MPSAIWESIVFWALSQALSFRFHKNNVYVNKINLQIQIHFSHLQVKQKQSFPFYGEKPEQRKGGHRVMDKI